MCAIVSIHGTTQTAYYKTDPSAHRKLQIIN